MQDTEPRYVPLNWMHLPETVLLRKGRLRRILLKRLRKDDNCKFSLLIDFLTNLNLKEKYKEKCLGKI